MGVDIMDQMGDLKVLWTDKKRILGRPWSFTRYTLTEDALTVTKGFLTRRESQLLLFRIPHRASAAGSAGKGPGGLANRFTHAAIPPFMSYGQVYAPGRLLSSVRLPKM